MIREAILRTRELLLRPVKDALVRLFRLIMPKVVIGGVEVADFSTSDDGRCLDRVADALGLIEQFHPILLARLGRYLKGIVIYEGRTGFLLGRGYCVLNRAIMEGLATDRIAYVLAHEAAHAVLDAHGIDDQTYSARRQEDACIRAEIRLARRLPGGEAEIGRIAENFHRTWWDSNQPDSNE